jgi:8-oxo-dGTP pyrophosphatase MutT (NUDIX family)
MYKVFIQNRPVILSSAPMKSGPGADRELTFKYFDKSDIKLLFKLLKNFPDIKKINLFHPDLDHLWTDFKAYFKVIEAAGGLVKNEKGEILFIFRRGSWDLPKGKLERKETIRDGAVREVKEECGLEEVKLIDKITTTYHVYKYKGKKALKPSHWYLMHSSSKEVLVPQTEEDITDIRWIDPKDLAEVRKNVFPNILEVVNKVI